MTPLFNRLSCWQVFLSYLPPHRQSRICSLSHNQGVFLLPENSWGEGESQKNIYISCHEHSPSLYDRIIDGWGFCWFLRSSSEPLGRIFILSATLFSPRQLCQDFLCLRFGQERLQFPPVPQEFSKSKHPGPSTRHKSGVPVMVLEKRNLEEQELFRSAHSPCRVIRYFETLSGSFCIVSLG